MKRFLLSFSFVFLCWTVGGVQATSLYVLAFDNATLEASHRSEVQTAISDIIVKLEAHESLAVFEFSNKQQVVISMPSYTYSLSDKQRLFARQLQTIHGWLTTASPATPSECRNHLPLLLEFLRNLPAASSGATPQVVLFDYSLACPSDKPLRYMDLSAYRFHVLVPSVVSATDGQDLCQRISTALNLFRKLTAEERGLRPDEWSQKLGNTLLITCSEIPSLWANVFKPDLPPGQFNLVSLPFLAEADAVVGLTNETVEDSAPVAAMDAAAVVTLPSHSEVTHQRGRLGAVGGSEVTLVETLRAEEREASTVSEPPTAVQLPSWSPLQSVEVVGHTLQPDGQVDVTLFATGSGGDFEPLKSPEVQGKVVAINEQPLVPEIPLPIAEVVNTQPQAGEPVALCALLDDSGSVASTDPQEERYRSLLALIDELPDNVALCVDQFNQRVLNGFSDDKAVVKQAIHAHRSADGGTPLYESILRNLKQLATASTPNRLLIVFCDGNANTTLMEEAIALAQQHQIVIHTVGLNLDPKYTHFRELPRHTQGVYVPVEQASELSQHFQRLGKISTRGSSVVSFPAPVQVPGHVVQAGDQVTVELQVRDQAVQTVVALPTL